MNLGLFRREHLQSGEPKLIGSATVDQFQRTHGAIGAWTEVEHDDAGRHTDITADTLHVKGGTTLDGDLNAPNTYGVFKRIRLQSESPAALIFAAVEGDENVSLTRESVSGTPVLTSVGNLVPRDSLTWHLGMTTRVWAGLRALAAYIGGAGGTAVVDFDVTNGALRVDKPILPATTAVADLGAPAPADKRWRSLYLSSAIFEAGRTQAMGYWTAVPFNAANFGTTNGAALTLVPTAGQVTTNRFTVIGKTLTWVLSLDGFALGGPGPGANLTLRLPGGFVAAANVAVTGGAIYNNGGAWTNAMVQAAGSSFLSVVALPGFQWVPNAANYLYFTATLEVQ